MPVHNAGRHFSGCMDSIVHQTLREIEIILVLDCPTDGTELLARQYALQDKRIHLVENSRNLHIGASRNIGLQMAKGEYIHFSDHDDNHAPDMLEKMYAQAVALQCDMLVSAPASVQDGKVSVYNEGEQIRDKQGILQHLLGGGYDNKHTWSYYCNIHNILYRNAFLQEYAIRFVDTLTMTPEDYIFNAMCLLHAGQVNEIRDVLYYHELFADSAGHSTDYYSGKKRAAGLAYLHEYLQKHTADKTLLQQYDLYVARNYILLLFRAIESNRSIKEFVSLLRLYRTLPFTRTAFLAYRPCIKTDYQGVVKQSVLRLLVYKVVACR